MKNYPDWSIRQENDIAVIRIGGKDYVEIQGTTEKYPAAYPDTVQNQVIEHDEEKGRIKVLLGATRNIINEANKETRPKPVSPQTVWLAPYSPSPEKMEE